MRYLLLGAWAVFLLDLVVILQLVYNLLILRDDPTAQTAARGLLVLLGPLLAGTGVLLIVSTWLRSRGGLWIAFGLGAIPLFFAINTVIEGFWRGAPAP
ncbi:MAG: hypothetical protein AB7H90_11630 [Alphaproteobacteria bacterium]